MVIKTIGDAFALVGWIDEHIPCTVSMTQRSRVQSLISSYMVKNDIMDTDMLSISVSKIGNKCKLVINDAVYEIGRSGKVM